MGDSEGAEPCIHHSGGSTSLLQRKLRMRKSQFSEAQIVAVLKEGEAGVPVAELLRRHGISRNTYFNWKARYGGVTTHELRRLKEFEAEYAKLKRMYAEFAPRHPASQKTQRRVYLWADGCTSR